MQRFRLSRNCQARGAPVRPFSVEIIIKQQWGAFVITPGPEIAQAPSGDAINSTGLGMKLFENIKGIAYEMPLANEVEFIHVSDRNIKFGDCLHYVQVSELIQGDL